MFDQVLNCRNKLTGTQDRGISSLKLFSVIPLANIGYARASTPTTAALFTRLEAKGADLVLKCSQAFFCAQVHSALNPESRKAAVQIPPANEFLKHFQIFDFKGGKCISTLKQSFISSNANFLCLTNPHTTSQCLIRPLFNIISLVGYTAKSQSFR